MALFGDDQGKTEKPTPGRMAEVRERGDTHMSRDLVTAGALLVATIALRCFGGWLLDALAKVMEHGLQVDLRDHPIADASISGACREMLWSLLAVAAPLGVLLSILVLSVAIFGYGQIGIHFSTEVLGFKLERLNPAANWKRLFSPQSLLRTVFAALKTTALTAVLWLVLRNRWQGLSHLQDQGIFKATQTIADLVFLALMWVAGVVFALALADVIWQRFDFEKRNMMTRQEVEDERKRSEGDPMVKSRMQRARAELLRHRMMEAVPKADVVITNPTHFAVALKYDRKRRAAPEVIAKGADDMAMRIRELAKANNVSLLEDPPLARALYRAVKIGDEIPARFYEAVATVLSHVYRLKNRVA
ncbi:MAG: flagellar biosynthesis protein FlhB [Planctomycetes bacterium]|nr:flagellar biosynthesis protein FlhB [Planctomycetota bacterium]